MIEITQALLRLSGELKEIKAYIEMVRKSRLQIANEEWIDAQDVKQLLNISQRTLQKLRSNGTLPYSKLNGKFYYKLTDIENLLEANYKSNLKGNESK